MPLHLIFLIVFLSLFFIRFFLERFLSAINLRHALAHQNQIPSLLKSSISEETYKSSIAYTQTQTRYSHIHETFGVLLTLVYLFSGFIPWLQQIIETFPLNKNFKEVTLLLSFGITAKILALPFSWYETFHLESQFGFNKTTPKTFWLDEIKSFFLLLVIGSPFLFILFWLIQQTGDFWWIWGASFVIGFQLLMLILYPLLIAPLFNRFTPIEEGDLKERLKKLAQQCAFATQGIFVMDGSKRSSHSNAYFTGIGKSRRIVLFDTLIQQLTPSELVAVLAHEIGHYKKAHIFKMISLSTLLTLIGFFILSLLIYWQPMYQAFGITTHSFAVGILVFSLIASPFTFWITPFLNKLSRKHEYEADAYAIQQTQDPSWLKGALIKLSEKNLSNLLPHPTYSNFYYSHPTLIERLTAIDHLKSTASK